MVIFCITILKRVEKRGQEQSSFGQEKVKVEVIMSWGRPKINNY